MSRIPPPPSQLANLTPQGKSTSATPSKEGSATSTSAAGTPFQYTNNSMNMRELNSVASPAPPLYVDSAFLSHSGATDALRMDRALPEVPLPVVDFLDTSILFNGDLSSTLIAVRPRPAEPSSSLRGKLSSSRSTSSAHRRTASNVSEAPLSTSPPINLQALATHFLAEGTLHPEDAIRIIRSCETVMRDEPNILSLEEPLTVVGDIHGQYYDLMKLLEIGGDPSEQPYLFLGDYVDRGCFSCACVLYLYALKLCYPSQVFLLRGNHEGRHLTSYFSFKAECYLKYTPEFYDACMTSFDCLPLAATVGDRYFCVHGGLSPEVMHLEEIAYLYRFREIPTAGAMCDLLWSDPHWDVENPVQGGSGAPDSAGRPYDFSASAYFETDPVFTPNEARGCSFYFNFACLFQFIQTNNILCVIRAHEAQEEGYKLYRPHPQTHFPSMLSLFSAPNYCDSYDNKGAILTLRGGQMVIKQFFSSPHPYVLPNFINGIEWSFPFVVDKVAEILHVLDSLLPPLSEEEEQKLNAEYELAPGQAECDSVSINSVEESSVSSLPWLERQGSSHRLPSRIRVAPRQRINIIGAALLALREL